MVADGEIGDVFSQSLHHACRFVPKRHRQGAWPVPIDD
jgi:hypothetical protein